MRKQPYINFWCSPHILLSKWMCSFLMSSGVSTRLCGLFWSPWPLLILLSPLRAIAYLPLSLSFILSPLRPPTYILTVPPRDFSLLCVIASLFAPGDGLGSAILSTVPSQIHLHPLPARSLSWAALEEISDDLTFQQKQGILGSAVGCEALFLFPPSHIHLPLLPRIPAFKYRARSESYTAWSADKSYNAASTWICEILNSLPIYLFIYWLTDCLHQLSSTCVLYF